MASGCSAGFSPHASVTSGVMRASGTHSATGTGVVVPLYVYPGPQWDAVINAKVRYPSVRILIIANVDSGPGNGVDPTYVSFVEKAQMAGINVLGYVYTQYGKRSATTVDADMAKWEAYYHTDGIFLDQMSPHSPSYYQAATAYAHAHSLWLVMGNPGANAPGSAGPDVINYYERSGYPSLSFLKQRAHLLYGSSRWSYIAGAVPFKPLTVRATAPFVAYLFATNGKEPECYCRLPSYFTRLVATLSTL
ncbi:MAG: spherulation-specific family 4 protein [Candidatus Eremiobacteraeota bacterium]|nr:spherulation-specific family 4 protein [Candidatus Eremiobacteraeota bacterium]